MADEASRKDEDHALAAAGEEEALLDPGPTPGDELDDDDAPAPETGLHALGQLGTAVLVVGGLIVAFLIVALAGPILRPTAFGSRCVSTIANRAKSGGV